MCMIEPNLVALGPVRFRPEHFPSAKQCLRAVQQCRASARPEPRQTAVIRPTPHIGVLLASALWTGRRLQKGQEERNAAMNVCILRLDCKPMCDWSVEVESSHSALQAQHS